MVDSGYVLGVIAAMGAVTFALRALPFVAGHWLQKYPWVHSLGQFLPLAIMTLLLVNSGLAAAAEHAFGPWPELLAISLVAGLQWLLERIVADDVPGDRVAQRCVREHGEQRDPGEHGEGREGDLVDIAECRRLSSRKAWRLVRVVKRAEQA